MDDEEIVLVNEQGEPTGERANKQSGHTANTKLHSAFSCYVFNDKGQLLVTKRAASKKVWPGVWTNSVCGHPLPGEDRVDAIVRRLDYELGMKAKKFVVVLPQYSYKTPPHNGIIENEFCPVYVAIAASQPMPNPSEVSDYEWLNWDDFKKAAQADSDDYSWFAIKQQSLPPNDAPKWSWWCKDQLSQLKDQTLVKEYSKTVWYLTC